MKALHSTASMEMTWKELKKCIFNRTRFVTLVLSLLTELV